MNDFLNIKDFIKENSGTIDIKTVSDTFKMLDSGEYEEFLNIFDKILPRLRENYEIKESVKNRTKDILRKRFIY